MTRLLTRAELALIDLGCLRTARRLIGDLPRVGDGGKIMTVQGSAVSAFCLHQTVAVEKRLPAPEQDRQTNLDCDVLRSEVKR